MPSLIVTDEAAHFLEKFTEISLDIAQNGMDKKDWEDSRSYAIEAIKQLLRDNPQEFRYAEVLEKILSDRLQQRSLPLTSTQPLSGESIEK